MGRLFPSASKNSQRMGAENLVPNWKMLPISMPRDMRSAASRTGRRLSEEGNFHLAGPGDMRDALKFTLEASSLAPEPDWGSDHGAIHQQREFRRIQSQRLAYPATGPKSDFLVVGRAQLAFSGIFPHFVSLTRNRRAPARK